MPTLGARSSLALATLLFSLAPVLTWATLTHLHTRYWSHNKNIDLKTFKFPILSFSPK